jgi:large subunit ribosomal protein L16
MLQPKKTKFRKAHKGRIHGKSTSCNMLDFGAFGLKATEPDRPPDRAGRARPRYEACRTYLIRVFRMFQARRSLPGAHGFRRGAHRYWQPVKPGRDFTDGAQTTRALTFARGSNPTKTPLSRDWVNKGSLENENE